MLAQLLKDGLNWLYRSTLSLFNLIKSAWCSFLEIFNNKDHSFFQSNHSSLPAASDEKSCKSDEIESTEQRPIDQGSVSFSINLDSTEAGMSDEETTLQKARPSFNP